MNKIKNIKVDDIVIVRNNINDIFQLKVIDSDHAGFKTADSSIWYKSLGRSVNGSKKVIDVTIKEEQDAKNK